MPKETKSSTQMQVSDPESAMGWKRVQSREDPVDDNSDSGFSFALVLGMIVTVFIVLGYPWYLIGRRIYHGFTGIGLTAENALTMTWIVAGVYALTLLIASVVSHRSRSVQRRKRLNLFIRIAAIIVPALAMGGHLFQYYQASFAGSESGMPLMTIGFSVFMALSTGIVFWMFVSKFLVPSK
ncbi:MAG: hypothetical protein K9N46_06955 [Candidatus Marinimicrobia bacterium]|nr:hypothetical protein [Candidatus Neomarinimicrobiota bacterium]MCF7828719.1 hypothetical protein [Candidatus Neomarinimicrobiota bacterium]MCF7880460.1 hypothetical protein [Candidatus Neomarinimicrobiota bacterium]